MIRRGESDDDYVVCVEIYNAVNPTSPIDLAVFDSRPTVLIHGSEGYVLVKESSVAGCAYTPVRVRPEARRRGIGSELLVGASNEARALGLEALFGHVNDTDEATLGWLTRRGFVEVSRDYEQVRELAHPEAPSTPPAGIEVRLSRDSDLDGIYAVAVEATPDMAVAGIRALPYEQWRRESMHATFHVAVEDGQIVGFATLTPYGAVADTLEHELTGVLRSHRRRGIGSALKRGQIAWAAENGYRRLITWTQSENAAMRGLNLSLGYVERLDEISVKGPLQ